MNTIYGYVRISTKRQSIDRQIQNIKNEYPDAIIVLEVYTGKTIIRPQWQKLLNKVKSGDTIVFDAVSRMSRNADEGVATYFDLFNKGVSLVFLKEPYINTEVYAENIKDRLALQGTDEDEIFKGLNNYFRKLAIRQIRIAFEQAEKEIQNTSQRTKEGIAIARLNGKSIGRHKGATYITKKQKDAMKAIQKYSKDFDGGLNDADCIKLIGISRNSFYKYKQAIRHTVIEEALQESRKS